MIYRSLALVLTAFSLAAAARKSLSTVVNDCSFTLGGKEYDLCPLFNRENEEWLVEVETETPPTITKNTYRLALGGSLKRDGTLPDHEQCPEGTWVCMTASNRRPDHRSEPPRILQLIPVAGSLSSGSHFTGEASNVDVTAQINAEGDTLEIRLHGGHYVKQPQKARFQFLCDSDASEPSQPAFAWSWNGTHTFSWATSHACGVVVAEKGDQSSDNNSGESDSPPTDDEPEEDLVGSLPSRSTGRTLGIVFAITTSTILIIGYLIYSPPQQLKQWATSHLNKSRGSPLPFRVGENTLLRWAEEDMGLDEEDDMMVNDHEYYDFDEQIPLKPSPRNFSSKLRDYGSSRK